MGEMSDMFNVEYQYDLMNSKEHFEYGQTVVSPNNGNLANHNTMVKGEKGKATVNAITQNGTWTKGDGTLMYNQEVTLAINGTGDIMDVATSSKTETPPYKVDDTVEYECWGEYNGTPKCSIKKPFDRAGGGGRSADPKVQASIIRQFAFREANLFLMNNGYEDLTGSTHAERMAETGLLAEAIIKWVNND